MYTFDLLESRSGDRDAQQGLFESFDEREFAGATELSREVVEVEVPDHPTAESLALQPLHLR